MDCCSKGKTHKPKVVLVAVSPTMYQLCLKCNWNWFQKLKWKEDCENFIQNSKFDLLWTLKGILAKTTFPKGLL